MMLAVRFVLVYDEHIMTNAAMGQRLQAARKHAGLSAHELARRIGKHPSQLSRWETGQTMPTIPQVVAIARECDVAVGWIIDGEGELPPSDGGESEPAAA